MNTWALKIVFLSLCFSFIYASKGTNSYHKEFKCDFGWLQANKKCYKIFTKSVPKSNVKECETLATHIPKEFPDKFGYSENVWIKKDGQLNVSATNLKEGEPVDEQKSYYPLCTQKQNGRVSLQLQRNVSFYEDKWIIPNSKFIINKATAFMDWLMKNEEKKGKKNEKDMEPFDMSWVGIIFNGSFFWSDGLELSLNQKTFLNITNGDAKKGQCGMLNSKGRITFRNCTECRYGIGKLTEVPTTITTSEHRTTVTEQPSITPISTSEPAENITQMTSNGTEATEQSSQQTSNATTEQTTVTEQPSITPIPTSEQLTTVAENLSTTDSKTSSKAPDNETVRASTTEKSPSTPASCVCTCRETPRTKEQEKQFKESIKEIKIKKTDASKYKRSKGSAPDERTSSRAIGTIAVGLMAIPFGLIIISDLPILILPLIKFLRNKFNAWK